MPRTRRHLGASAAVPHLWQRRLLRRLEEQARDEALPFHQPSDRHIDRARRGLELVLHRRGGDGAAFPPLALVLNRTMALRSPWSPLQNTLFRSLWIATIV